MSNEHTPTPAQRLLVKELYACGIKKERIAERIGIHLETLNKKYKLELEDNFENMVNQLATNLYRDAVEGDTKSREFWLKTRARWSYAKDVEDEKPKDNALLTQFLEILQAQAKASPKE